MPENYFLMRFKALILDLDGTVYLDGTPIKNVISQLIDLHLKNVHIQFLTNNTSVEKTTYVNKLKKMGLYFVEDTHVLSPIDAFIAFAKKEKIKHCYYLLPNKVIEYIEENGGPKMGFTDPDLVLVGFDRELTYEKLERACGLINSNVPYSITHIDLACPTKYGPIPDCGSISNLIRNTTNKKWEYDFGKPSYRLGDIIVSLLKEKGIAIEESVLIGDRYYTDIALGNLIGAKTCHVQTGESFVLSENDPDNLWPTFEYKNICEFIQSELSNC